MKKATLVVMEKTILKHIQAVFHAAQKSPKRNFKLGRVASSIEATSSYLNCNREESVVFCVIFALNLQKPGGVSPLSFIEHTGEDTFSLVSYKQIFDQLERKKLIMRDQFRESGFLEEDYLVRHVVFNSIAYDKPIPKQDDISGDLFQTIEFVHNLFEQRRESKISSADYFRDAENYLRDQEKVPLILELKKKQLTIPELLFFLEVCFQFADGSDTASIREISLAMFDRMQDRISFKRASLEAKSILFKEDLLRFSDGFFIDEDNEVELSDSSIEMLFNTNAEPGEVKKKLFTPQNLLVYDAESIREKPLFFNEKENRHVERLQAILHQDQLDKVMERLNHHHLSPGITILLYGNPGTGKTESVMQIARQTGRRLYQVDISQIRDKYVGESEKAIREIFVSYKKAAASQELTPILFFNESDALISKRVSITQSVDQMNNTMQNILLQELETFNGILFATSNMNENLDQAFERRFLFKIKFEKPQLEVRKKIWASRLKEWPETTISTLAEKFTFSGGQIDNVVKKIVLHELVEGAKPDLANLIEFCKEEISLNDEKSKKIGFERDK
ncbi:MAG: ATP-binding protein [Bacteroidetes bacterium]|nr:ATP-binding protein [Bacteroidota bacterium]